MQFLILQFNVTTGCFEKYGTFEGTESEAQDYINGLASGSGVPFQAEYVADTGESVISSF